MTCGVAQAEWEAEQRETSRDEQAYHNACDQGHDWDDYDDPVNLYGEDGYFGFNG